MRSSMTEIEIINAELGLTAVEAMELHKAITMGKPNLQIESATKKISGYLERIGVVDTTYYEVEIIKETGKYPCVIIMYAYEENKPIRIVTCYFKERIKTKNEEFYRTVQSYYFDNSGKLIKAE